MLKKHGLNLKVAHKGQPGRFQLTMPQSLPERAPLQAAGSSVKKTKT
jgi:hypothetical protein